MLPDCGTEEAGIKEEIMLPKILQPHDEKESRSIETQLNEAKEILATTLLAITVLIISLMAILIEIHLKEGLEFANILLQIVATFSCIRFFFISCFYRRP